MNEQPKLSRTSNEWRPARFRDIWGMMLIIVLGTALILWCGWEVFSFCFGWL